MLTNINDSSPLLIAEEAERGTPVRRKGFLIRFRKEGCAANRLADIGRAPPAGGPLRVLLPPNGEQTDIPACANCRQIYPAWAAQQASHKENSSRGGKYGNQDRKSTRLNSSHLGISYAVF